MTSAADALLDAHVQHELARLTGAQLDARIRSSVGAFFAWLEDVSLNDVLAREWVQDVMQHYVIDFKVTGGITELAGEMSNAVFSSSSARSTRVDEIVSRESFDDLADKLGELEGLARKLIRYVTHTEAFRTLASRLIVHDATRLLSRAPRTGAHDRKARIGGEMQSRFPGVQRQLGALVSRLGDVLAERIAADAERRLLEVVDNDWLRLMADEIWDEISRRPIADAGLLLSEGDLEDFVVLGYEVWRRFRKTDYFRTVSFEVVDRVFQKYGEESVRSVILDLGVTEDMIARELSALLRPFLEQARRSGFLESQIRARLEPFYRSTAVSEILGGRSQ